MESTPMMLNKKQNPSQYTLVNVLNLFSKLRDVWEKYAAVILMFLSIHYAIIMVMLSAVFMKYGESEFYRVLLSAVFVYGVRDQRNPEQEIDIQIIYFFIFFYFSF